MSEKRGVKGRRTIGTEIAEIVDNGSGRSSLQVNKWTKKFACVTWAQTRLPLTNGELAHPGHARTRHRQHGVLLPGLSDACLKSLYDSSMHVTSPADTTAISAVAVDSRCSGTTGFPRKDLRSWFMPIAAIVLTRHPWIELFPSFVEGEDSETQSHVSVQSQYTYKAIFVAEWSAFSQTSGVKLGLECRTKEWVCNGSAYTDASQHCVVRKISNPINHRHFPASDQQVAISEVYLLGQHFVFMNEDTTRTIRAIEAAVQHQRYSSDLNRPARPIHHVLRAANRLRLHPMSP